MTNPLATETIMGLPVEETYKVVETVLPNGRIFKQLFQRVYMPDGKEDWQLVDEKLKAFDERFADTTTVPANWKANNTEVLVAKERETAHTIQQGGMTRIDMRRQLILGLGDENWIIQHKGLDEQRLKFFEKNASTLTLLTMMAKAHGGKWAEAAKFLKPVYPDSYDSIKDKP